MASIPLQSLGLLFITFVLLAFSHALSLIDSPTLNLDMPTNSTTVPDTGTRVPGGSPFAYVGRPFGNLLQITSLNKTPNPCTLLAHLLPFPFPFSTPSNNV